MCIHRAWNSLALWTSFYYRMRGTVQNGQNSRRISLPFAPVFLILLIYRFRFIIVKEGFFPADLK